ncbi:MAG: hypothetical protein PUG09_11595, partial [Prevotella sp.]|nr:hypothetical protein [Prevotella sp.]
GTGAMNSAMTAEKMFIIYFDHLLGTKVMQTREKAKEKLAFVWTLPSVASLLAKQKGEQKRGERPKKSLLLFGLSRVQLTFLRSKKVNKNEGKGQIPFGSISLFLII